MYTRAAEQSGHADDDGADEKRRMGFRTAERGHRMTEAELWPLMVVRDLGKLAIRVYRKGMSDGF